MTSSKVSLCHIRHQELVPAHFGWTEGGGRRGRLYCSAHPDVFRLWRCCASALTNEKCGFRWDGGHRRILKRASGVVAEIGAERSNGGASPSPAADIS